MAAQMLPILSKSFVVLYFDPYSKDGIVRVHSKFLSVRQPSSGNAAGLYESFSRALSHVGIVDWQQKLMGFGCDGASVNMGANALCSLLEQVVPWVICFWCLIHHLQLALKDSLKSTFFSNTIVLAISKEPQEMS